MTIDIVADLADLRRLVDEGRRDFAILLDHNAYSRKTVSRRGSRWVVVNHIDDTRQVLDDQGLWSESNIGTALDRGAFAVLR